MTRNARILPLAFYANSTIQKSDDFQVPSGNGKFPAAAQKDPDVPTQAGMASPAQHILSKVPRVQQQGTAHQSP